MYFKQDLFNIDDNLLKRNKNIFESVKKNLFEKIQKEEFGFVNNLKNNNLKVLKKVSKELLKFDNILFLGTGGSSLGGKTLASMKKEFVLKIKNPKIFFIENIDEQPINDLLKTINLSKTAVVVISKSGETLETLAQYYLILNEMKKNKISVEGKYYILTENKNSTLKQIQENEKFYFIEHDKNIGGRYSVFSIVGLLPAKLSGVNVEILCDEAITFLDSIFSKKNNIFDDLFKPVFSQFLLMKEGFNINVFMPYIDSFHNLSYWLRQLWAESVGKNGNGTTLVNALGTVDQHSQLQLYLDGPRDKFFTII
ncbi:MAG: Glucose-6-phosphate isomerase, partial [Alphaproteobacteria bacterium MarineAlpha8_Bin1]